MSKLSKELKNKGVKPVIGSDGRRIQCPYCRSKALENDGKNVKCHACGKEFSM